MGKQFGIDVSKHNDVIDWERVKPQIDFAIIRGGYSTVIDSKARYNAEKCNKLGIPLGVYWFSYALTKSDAINEAKKCLDLVSNYSINLPIFFDYEYDSVRYANEKGVKVTQELVRTLTETFCEYIRNAGYKVGFYANTDWVNNYYGRSYVERTPYTFWLAHWKKDEPKGNHEFWQYTDKATIDGINGGVDANIRHTDDNKLKTLTIELNY